MRSSVDLSSVSARAVAGRLCGEDVLALALLDGGGNNRLYQARTTSGLYALKAYGSSHDAAARLQREYGGLQFLHANGAGGSVPQPIASDPVAGFALYEWIEGRPLTSPSVHDVDAVVAFLHAVHEARTAPDAQALPEAAEACLSAAILVEQIEQRIRRLRLQIAPGEAAAVFVEGELVPEFMSRKAAIEMAGGNSYRVADRALAFHARTLAPSDLSFHNVVRRLDGRLTFLDFEYFGWDDPVKLVSDFLWHPAMALSAEQAARFATFARELYGAGDSKFEERLRLYFPLFGLRWCLIILNEFLAEHWERRRFSGDGRCWNDVKAAQLQKSRRLLADVRAGVRSAVTW